MSNKFIVGFLMKVLLSFICFVTLTVGVTSCNDSKDGQSPGKVTERTFVTNWINWKVPKDSIKYGESERYVLEYLDSINTEKHTHFRVLNWKNDSTSSKSLFTATADLGSTSLADSTTPVPPPYPGPRLESSIRK